MATKKIVLSLDVEVETEQRNGYFASRTKPFAITVYAQKEYEAEMRAMEAIELLLRQYAKTPNKLSTYLNLKNVKHVLYSEVGSTVPYPAVRTCKTEMRLEVPAGAGTL